MEGKKRMFEYIKWKKIVRMCLELNLFRHSFNVRCLNSRKVCFICEAREQKSRSYEFRIHKSIKSAIIAVEMSHA